MNLWLLIPRDPLIFRDGKPFTATPGERSKSLLFPYPSTTAGAIRTIAGTDTNTGIFDTTQISRVKGIPVHGPFLVEINQTGEITEWFFPTPADALIVNNEQPIRYNLSPIEQKEETVSNLPQGLSLIGSKKSVKDKPISNPPLYWPWTQFSAWLDNPADGPIDLSKLGIRGPKREHRTHVSISPENLTALPGALFQTSGMEFVHTTWSDEEAVVLSETQNLALAIKTDATLQEGAAFLGGERRIIHCEHGLGKFPECPSAVREKIITQGHCRLILSTPAFFKEGYLPTWLKSMFGMEIAVKAVALPRYQTISGWDYEKRQPKPTRRLVPSGSVYFVKIGGSQSDIENFVDRVWLNPISDDEQSRNDGFGLALLGAWDGKLRKMEVEK